MLVVLGSDDDKLLVFKVGNHEPVAGPNCIVTVDIARFVLFRVQHHCLDEEIVVVDIIIEQVKGDLIVRAQTLDQKVELAVFVDVDESDELSGEPCSLRYSCVVLA